MLQHAGHRASVCPVREEDRSSILLSSILKAALLRKAGQYEYTMRAQEQDGRRPRLRPLDLLALLLVLLYAAVALVAQLGASLGGQGLDPVWAAARQRGTLRVASDFGFAPFTESVGGQPAGYDIDLARAVAAKLGLRVEFVSSNLDSIYDDLARGRADMAASALPYAPEQGWRVSFSTFYFNAGQVLVARAGAPISSTAELAGRSVGVALGSDADTYARGLAARDPRIRLRSTYDTAAAALADLRRGALDAVITDNTSALIELGRAPGLRLVAALTLEPYALAVPAPAFQLQAEINRALDELRREGFFEQLGARWFVDQGVSARQPDQEEGQGGRSPR
jgi:polar amino acid transport system substrate-binding protein